MQLEILFFASFRERLGVSGQQLTVTEEVATVAQLRAWLVARHPDWESVLGEGERVMTAVNQTLAGDDDVLSEGDEVAFFPPVTGG